MYFIQTNDLFCIDFQDENRIFKSQCYVFDLVNSVRITLMLIMREFMCQFTLKPCV